MREKQGEVNAPNTGLELCSQGGDTPYRSGPEWFKS